MTMTSKERALRNYTFQKIDRFTIDFCASSDVYAKLRDHFGVADDLELMKILHVDFRYPKPKWIGFPLVDGLFRHPAARRRGLRIRHPPPSGSCRLCD